MHPKYNQRISFRLTKEECRWLSKLSADGGYSTLSQFLKSLMLYGLFTAIRDGESQGMSFKEPVPDSVSSEVHGLFRDCEDMGLRMSFPADVNKRK